eukprot:TRINITY_DN104323_c0_g1_i1.p1 TRINITY_DN104323_c0_g1~~TRINITY_DN104323_c0_g1_i1.p1  ORF type:complete len:710 (-),score=82.14 TRINITY_DN104323_c0_g1_i1:290-2419(-)
MSISQGLTHPIQFIGSKLGLIRVIKDVHRFLLDALGLHIMYEGQEELTIVGRDLFISGGREKSQLLESNLLRLIEFYRIHQDQIIQKQLLQFMKHLEEKTVIFVLPSEMVKRYIKSLDLSNGNTAKAIGGKCMVEMPYGNNFMHATVDLYSSNGLALSNMFDIESEIVDSILGEGCWISFYESTTMIYGIDWKRNGCILDILFGGKEFKNTPLHNLVSNKSWKEIKKIIQEEDNNNSNYINMADCGSENLWGWTPLHVAALKNDDSETLLGLLGLGGSKFSGKLTKLNESILHIAALSTPTKDNFKDLLAHCPSSIYNLKDKTNNTTFLHRVVLADTDPLLLKDLIEDSLLDLNILSRMTTAKGEDLSLFDIWKLDTLDMLITETLRRGLYIDLTDTDLVAIAKSTNADLLERFINTFPSPSDKFFSSTSHPFILALLDNDHYSLVNRIMTEIWEDDPVVSANAEFLLAAATYECTILVLRIIDSEEMNMSVKCFEDLLSIVAGNGNHFLLATLIRVDLLESKFTHEDLNAILKISQRLLCEASTIGNLSIVKCLLERWDVNVTDIYYGVGGRPIRCLHKAIENGHFSVAKELLWVNPNLIHTTVSYKRGLPIKPFIRRTPMQVLMRGNCESYEGFEALTEVSGWRKHNIPSDEWEGKWLQGILPIKWSNDCVKFINILENCSKRGNIELWSFEDIIKDTIKWNDDAIW